MFGGWVVLLCCYLCWSFVHYNVRTGVLDLCSCFLSVGAVVVVMCFLSVLWCVVVV